MKIEFSDMGTNVEVRLLENLGGQDAVKERIYTNDHQAGIWFGEDLGVTVNAADMFEWVLTCWSPPTIGGKYAYLHPYWHELEQKKLLREQCSTTEK